MSNEKKHSIEKIAELRRKLIRDTERHLNRYVDEVRKLECCLLDVGTAVSGTRWGSPSPHRADSEPDSAALAIRPLGSIPRCCHST